jgi:hypothetical protein
MIEVDMTFTPIHDFAPQYSSTFINNTPISKDDTTASPAGTNDTINSVSLTSQEETDAAGFIPPAPSFAPTTSNISLQPGAIELI